MEYIGYALVVVGIAAIAYGIVASRRRPDAGSAAADAGSDDVSDINARVRPRVLEFHVMGEEARVAFDVPLPPTGADKILSDLLEYEGIEVLRAKAKTLPIDQVKKITVLAGSTVVGSVQLPSPGVLPPEMEPPVPLRFAAGDDPLSHTLGAHVDPSGAGAPSSDVLAPLSSELRIPASLDAALRANGVDVQVTDAPELVRGLIDLHRYTIEPRDDRTYLARKGGMTTFVRDVAHGPGDHPELDEKDIRGFVAEFIQSGADRGLLVTAKYAPFAIYEREKLEPRIQFISRERLQSFVDRMATS